MTINVYNSNPLPPPSFFVFLLCFPFGRGSANAALCRTHLVPDVQGHLPAGNSAALLASAGCTGPSPGRQQRRSLGNNHCRRSRSSLAWHVRHNKMKNTIVHKDLAQWSGRASRVALAGRRVVQRAGEVPVLARWCALPRVPPRGNGLRGVGGSSARRHARARISMCARQRFWKAPDTRARLEGGQFNIF